MYESGKAYFLKVWRGQRSLTETFWVWYVWVVCLLIYIGGAFLAAFLTKRLETEEPYLWYVAAIVIGTIWVNVGTWRSASRTGGAWSIVARVFIAVILLALISFLAATFMGVFEKS